MKGRKVGQTIVLETEPEIPDGTEVEVVLPTKWEADRDALLSVGHHPDFGEDIERVRQAWNPPSF